MKQKNIVKIVKGERLYTPATYARKYGRDCQEVYNMMRDGRLRVVTYRGRRYVTGEPPAGWEVAPDWSEPDTDGKVKTEEPELPDSPIVPAESSEAPAPKRTRTARMFDLNFEKARKTHAEADKAEVALSDKRGELADKYLNMFYNCFSKSIQPYRMALAELDLKGENIRLLQAALDKLCSDFKDNILRELSGTAEDETEDEA